MIKQTIKQKHNYFSSIGINRLTDNTTNKTLIQSVPLQSYLELS